MTRTLRVMLVFIGVLAIAMVMRNSQEPERSDTSGIPTPNADLASLLESIRNLEQRVARMETSLASRAAGATREPVKSGTSTADAPEPGAVSAKEVEALRADLVRVSERLAVTEAGLKDSGLRWVQNPTPEQLFRARKDVNWALVDEIRALQHQDYAAALERVSAMSIDDILQQLGQPTMQGGGIWYYTRPQPGGDERSTSGITLQFAGQRVVGVSASD